MGESRDTHMLNKLCDICGDVGYEELLTTCCQCTIGRHFYCMRVLSMDVSEDWVCEVCLSRNDIDSLKASQMRDVLDSSKEVYFDSGRQVACKRQKSAETGKVKFLPTEEVIKQSSGYPKKEFPIKSNFGSKPVPAKFTPSLPKRTFTVSKTVGPYFTPIKVRRTPSFLQLGSMNLPSRRGVQISSSISQHAVKSPKESKVESAHVVPDKENVCKGQILDVILPDKDLTIPHTKTKEAMRSTRRSPSRLHTTIVDSGRNYHDAAEHANSDVAGRETWNRFKISLYHPYVPALYSTWMGGFKFLDTGNPGEFYGGFLAQPPCRVHRKVYEFSLKMPPVLQVNLLQQCHLRTDFLKNGFLDLCDLALYFFPEDYKERAQKNYNQLFQLMVIKNSVMISYIDGVELLIFTSKQLHADSLDVFTRSNTDFFGGVFRCAKDNQMKVHQKLPSLVSHLECTHNGNANKDSREAVDMDVDMVGGKIVGIPDMVVSKESTPEFNKWAAKETPDAISNRKISTISGDWNSVIEPISIKKECCNDSDLPSKSTEKIESKFALEPVEHPLESSHGRLPGSIGDILPIFEVMSKLNCSDRAPKASSVEEKINLDERRILSQVKQEIGSQGTLQVASGVGRPQPRGFIEDASLRGSQNQHQVLTYHLINDHSAARSPPCLLGDGTKVGSVIKIERNDNEKPFESREKKDLQGPPFLSRDNFQIADSCAVEVKAEVPEVANDPSAACPPRLLNKETKIGLQTKTQEYVKEKPDETREKKDFQAGLFNGPCALKRQKASLNRRASMADF